MVDLHRIKLLLNALGQNDVIILRFIVKLCIRFNLVHEVLNVDLFDIKRAI